MPSLQAALSVTEAIETYGAYAGLAAVVGLGVLSLLYFAQAREVKSLREWAAGAEEREADFARRVVAQASRAAVAAGGRAGVPQTAAGQAKRPAAPAAAGATVAAAAAVAKVADPPTGAHPAPAVPATAASAAATAAAGGPATQAPAAPNGQPPMVKPAEAPPASPPAPGVPAPLPAPDTGDSGPVPPVRTAAPRPLRAGAPSATLPPRAGESAPRRATQRSGGRSSGRVAGIAAAVVLGILVIAFGATQLLGGDDAGAPSSTVGETVAQPAAGGGADSGEPTATTGSGAPEPSSVNVAVLNGTTVAGLAAEIARSIEEAGYVRGTVTNSPDQSRSATIVSYREGSRAAALKVALQVGVGEDAVRPLDPSDAVTAGEDADVVVVVGADRTDLP